MADSPRFHFFSLTFLIGFGVGAFVGVALGLMAFAVVGNNDVDQPAEALAGSTTTSASPTSTPVRARTNAAIDVRIGPGAEYAAVGTIGKGEPLEISGRDNSSEWIAISFPPGSTSRGWLPAKAIENLTEVNALAVVAPTPLPRSIATPTNSFVPGTAGSNRGTIPGNDNPIASITGTPDVAIGTPLTPSARTTLTPQATKPTGDPDLTVSGVSRLPDGRVRVVVTNKANADLVGHRVMAIVADPTTRSEILRAAGTGLRAGESVTLESDTFLVTAPTSVIATVDPSYSYPDADRSNNTMTTSLAPPVSPTPTPNLSTID